MIIDFHSSIISKFEKLADPIRAIGQQKYMKSKLQFYSIQNPIVKKITNIQLRRHPILDNDNIVNSLNFYSKMQNTEKNGIVGFISLLSIKNLYWKKISLFI